MNSSTAEDLDFLENLADFLALRDEALNRPSASPLLSSMRSYAAGVVSLQMFKEMERMNKAQELHKLIAMNGERVAYLNKRASKLEKRQDTWKESTRKRNQYRLRAWYREAVGLYQQTEVAHDKLLSLENENG